MVGELTRVQAELAVRRTSYRIGDSTERMPVTSPDQLLLGGTLAGGAVVSAHIQDGRLAGAGTRVELTGTEGVLVLQSTGPFGPGGIQMGELRLLGSRTIGGVLDELPLPERLFASGMADTGVEGFHVAQLYARLAADLRSGERTVPDFAEGLRLHRLLDAVRRADATGQRQQV
jgi:predicted dehydrogenase